MIKRLRVKFVCINMFIVMAVLLVMLGLLYRSTQEKLVSGSISALRAALGSQMRPGRPGSGDRAQPCFVLQEGANGELMVLGGEFFDLTDETMVLDIYLQAKDRQTQLGELEDYALRFYREPGPMGDRYAFTDISGEQETLRDLAGSYVLMAALGFVGFLGISVALAFWAVGPVARAWEQQRQFVADASHELKTPLTVILTNAEMLQAPDYSPEEKARFADSILDVSRQMRSLVENLLQLARADRGKNPVAPEKLDLSVLTENALLPFEPVYFERGLILESRITPGIRVHGDETGLRQVLDILLDNGQKYAAPGGTAQLTLTRQGRKAVLRFFTPGTPLTARQCEEIFGRFYRVDEARTPSGSYGLGLSIARKIMDQHRGRIWAESSREGNVFVVTLPELV